MAADPKIMMGKPIVAGTRITVELILEKLAAGETVDQILAANPRLTDEDVRFGATLEQNSLWLGMERPCAAGSRVEE